MVLAALAGQFFLAQPDKPWTLWIGLLFYGAALGMLGRQGRPSAGKTPALSPVWEGVFLVLILALAYFLRIVRIDSLPAGMHTDQGLIGQCALRILHDGWRPFGEVFDYEVPEVVLFYQMAGWFGLVGSSYYTFHLFFALLSLASFPLIYWTFRQWAGSRVALLSLFILASMRWNWIMTRNGYPSIQVPFYLFGALAFWVYWRKSRKPWAWALSALFTGVGFYTYQAFKIVPLLMGFFAVDEYSHEKKKSSKPFLLYFLLVLITILPLLGVMAQKGSLGHREADLFIGTRILEEKSLKPLWDVWTGTAQMFNRQGDGNPRHNIPGHRMLDDITGVLFILGLGLLWRRRKEPGAFYPLIGFSSMLLTGLLSSDPAHANRLVSLTPFVALFAGTALEWAWTSSQAAFKSPFARRSLPFLILAFILAQNAFTYFGLQASDPQCQNAFGPEQNEIGREIETSFQYNPGHYRYFITPFYFKNHTVTFLSEPARRDVLEFNLDEWVQGKVLADKPAVLFLERLKSGVIGFLKTRFPGLEATIDSTDSDEIVTLSLDPRQLRTLEPWDRGLKGVYIQSADWNSPPVKVKIDPVLNFISKFDFPFVQPPPFCIRWTGAILAPQSGKYIFQVLTTDQAQLWLDGKPVAFHKPFPLRAGTHSLRLDFEKDQGDVMVLHLVWRKPGEPKWEVIPATAFGKAPK